MISRLGKLSERLISIENTVIKKRFEKSDATHPK